MTKVVLLFLSVILFSFNSVADTKLIINNRVFNLLEQEKPNCGKEKGDPEYSAALFLLSTAQGLGEQSGSVENGVRSIFNFIRNYPSRFTSTSCALLRDVCEARCNKASIFSQEQCKIECNQYETWNR